MSAAARLPGRELELASPLGDNPATRTAILEQLDRVLESPLFSHSKRCGPLLRFIVMETLEGRSGQLKERAIGISVFGRTPAYDTTEDPIVRTSAVEVRKRIAQYYHEPGRDTELRIDLTSGSYIPKFSVSMEPAARVPLSSVPPPAVEVPTATSTNVENPSQERRFGVTRKGTAVGIVASVVIAAAIAIVRWVVPATPQPLASFWGPLLRAESVTLVMGGTGEMLSPTAGATGTVTEPSFLETIRADRVGFADGMTLARVAALFSAHDRKFEIRRGGSLTLQDLRKGPAVLVGAVNNPWTRRLEENLRFRFLVDEEHRATLLQDQQKGPGTFWKTERDVPYTQLKEDRAIISRFVDSLTEQTVVLIAGFGRDGTSAAGEFVTQPKYLQLLADRAPAGWEKRNVQVVIATDLINGHTGPPRIIATHFW